VIFDGGGLAGHTVGYIVKFAIAFEINHETDDKGKRETDGYHLWPHDKSTGGSSGGVKAEGYLYPSAFKNPDFWKKDLGRSSTLKYQKVWLPNPEKSLAFIRQYAGPDDLKPFVDNKIYNNYFLLTNNCKHFLIDAYNLAGANLTVDTPLPGTWPTGLPFLISNPDTDGPNSDW
jgi:hypothetical protein